MQSASVGQAAQERVYKEPYKFLLIKGTSRFVAELNRLGRDGYRLEKTTGLYLDPREQFDGFHIAAVLKFDPTDKWEYDWFEAYEPGEIVTRIGFRVAKGFYFSDVLRFSTTSQRDEPSTGDRTPTQQTMDLLPSIDPLRRGCVFLMERRKSSKVVKEYRVISGVLGLGKSPTMELQAQLDDKAEQGFKPMAFVISNAPPSILLERTLNSDTRPDSTKGEYRVVRTDLGLDGIFRKKANNIAKKGFKLMFANETYAVMQRIDDKRSNEYTWLGAEKKDIAARISRLSRDGFRFFSAAYGFHRVDFFEHHLIFVKDSVAHGTPSDYLLKPFPAVLDTGTKHDNSAIFIERAKKAEQDLLEVNKALSAGYTFRELVYGDGLNVLLELDN